LGGRVNLLKEPCQAAFEMNVNPCICCFCIFQLHIACWTCSHALRHGHAPTLPRAALTTMIIADV
jgi:TRAP-type C4-dicarboxylate transport system permease small subunit